MGRHSPARAPVQVNKPVALVDQFAALCNRAAAGSFDAGERKVNFEALDSVSAHVVGLFGDNDAICDLLIQQGARPRG